MAKTINKRKVKIISICLGVVFVIFTALFIFFKGYFYYRPLPLTENICFGLTDFTVKLLKGRPDSIELNELTGAKILSYSDLTISSHKADSEYWFIKGEGLTYDLFDVSHYFEASNKEEAEQLFNELLELAKEKYSGYENYYIDELITDEDGTHISLGVNEGAGGIDAHISYYEKKVYISITHMA